MRFAIPVRPQNDVGSQMSQTRFKQKHDGFTKTQTGTVWQKLKSISWAIKLSSTFLGLCSAKINPTKSALRSHACLKESRLFSPQNLSFIDSKVIKG